jgi:hypothetical protein
MEVYIGLFLIFLLLKVFSNSNNSNKFFIYFAVIILLIVVGFRASTVGTDTSTYIDNFLHEEFQVNIELGFKIYIKIIKFFSNSPVWFLLVAAFIQIIPLFKFLKLKSDDIIFSLLIFVLGGYFFFYLSALRQSIAISIILLSYHYFENKDYKRSVIYFSLAVLFHTTALMMLPIAFLARKIKINFKSAAIIIGISIVIGWLDILNFRGFLTLVGHSSLSNSVDVTERYRGYGSFASDVEKGPLRLIWEIGPASIICLMLISIKKGQNDFYVTLFFIGVVISNIFMKFPIAYRLTFYTTILQLTLVPNYFKMVRRKTLYQFSYILYLSFFFFYTIYIAYHFGLFYDRHDIVPYEFSIG